MGVLNVTPDSFSDGGRFTAVEAALDHAKAMVHDGADIIDVGGESTRPATFHDSRPLDPEEELSRVLPVLCALRGSFPDLPISIDTYKSAVASAALDAGANILNDISGATFDPEMASLAAERHAPLILMHLPGTPRELPRRVVYGDVVKDVASFLCRQADFAVSCGLDAADVIVDPGIGFGKGTRENLELLRRLPELEALGYPVLVGPSRKRFLGRIAQSPDPRDRVEATLAAISLSIAGGADIVRVHDVRQTVRAVRVSDAIVRGWEGTDEESHI